MTVAATIDQLTRELRDRYSTAPVWPAGFAGAYLGMGGRDPVFTGPEHAALIIGPPRSGKTTAVIIPALTVWPGPAVTTSTKPDVLNVTAPHRTRVGQVWCWDPTNTITLPAGVRPLRWSPLQGCADWDVATERAWMLTHAARPNPTGADLHWTERAAALIAPLLHAAAAHGRRLDEVIGWIQRHETWDPLDLLSVRPDAKLAHDLLSGIANTDSREQSGIWSTADSVLAAYRISTTLTAACQPNFDPEAFAKSNDTIYLVAPASRAEQHAPIVCALLDQIRHHTTSRTTTWPPMLWALDEIANIAPLPTLPSVVADGGAQGLLVLAALQDLSQARHRWGHQTDGFLTLFATTLLLPGVADPATLATVTTLAGRIDRPHHTVTRTGVVARQTATTTRRESLLPENVIAHGKPGHALHLRATHPSWLRLTPWHTTPWLRQQLTREDNR